MKYCRFQDARGTHYGEVVERGTGLWISGIISSPWQADLVAEGNFEPIPLSGATLLSPVTPSKIVCVGRNYRDHAKELGNEVPSEPLLFFKPPSSLLAPGGVVRMPKVAERVDFEGELAVVIEKRANKLKAGDDFDSYIHGYTLANDVTARDLQKKDGQWTRAKGFDTFCPAGPVVETQLDVARGVTIETRVNGQLRQEGSTLDFIFDLPALLKYITAAMTLEPGDLLLTGTPAGVGPLSAGDVVEVSLQNVPGMGSLTNSVAPELD